MMVLKPFGSECFKGARLCLHWFPICARAKEVDGTVVVSGDFVGQPILQNSEQRGLFRIIALFVGFYFQPVQRAGGRFDLRAGPRGLPGVVAVGIRKPGKSPFWCPIWTTHMPDNVQSLPTGGLWRRRSKARVKERQKIVIVGWSDHIGAALVELDGYCGPGTEVWIYSPMPTDDRTKLLESDMCSRQKALSNLTVHHWEGSLGARFCWKIGPSKRRAKFRFSQTPMRQSSAVRDDVVSWLAEVSEVHTKRVVAMMRGFGSVGESGPIIVLSLESFPAIACEHEASRAMFGQWW